MPFLKPTYDLKKLTQLCQVVAPQEQAIKHLFCYYVYLTTGIVIYHADLLNIPLNPFFAAARGGRHFDLQELEHRFTHWFLHPNTTSNRRINVKMTLEWHPLVEADLGEGVMLQLKEAVRQFSIEAYQLIGDLTPADYGSLGARLTQLKVLSEQTHVTLLHILPPQRLLIRRPIVSHLLEALHACCETHDDLWLMVTRLAKLRLTTDGTRAILDTLGLLPQDKHLHFFTELLRIAERGLQDLAELKQAVIGYCEHVQEHQGWEDISLNMPLTPLPSLLAITKPKYVNNGRWQYRHNPRYLRFCDTSNPSVPQLVHLIVQETGRFGKLHADSFICLLLQTAQQQHSLCLFSECLPMDQIDPETLVAESPAWWQHLWQHPPALSSPQHARDQLLQLLKQAAQNISLP